MKRIQKRVAAVLLALLISSMVVMCSYTEARAMGGVAAFTSYEVLGTILGLFGIGVCANGIAANSDTIQKNLQGMMDKVYDHAHSFNKWVDKGEAWINDKLDSWWELWKGGVIDMSDEAMDFFRSFAGTQYEEMKMPSGAEKKLHFEAGTTLVSIGLDYTGVTYGFNYTQFLEPVDIVLFDYQKHIGKCLLIMSSDGSSEIDYIGSSKRWLSSYQEALKGLQIAPGVNPDSRDSPFYLSLSNPPGGGDGSLGSFGEIQFDLNSFYDIGYFYLVESAANYVHSHTEEDLIAIQPETPAPDIPAPNVHELAPDIPELYTRDNTLKNYDVITNTGVIGANGVIEQDRSVAVTDLDTLTQVANGEMTWQEFMAKAKALGLDITDGLTVDTPVVGNQGDEDKKNDTIGGVYVPTPGDSSDFTADLKKLFPFCIPFDLVRAFKVLDAEPIAPVFVIPFKINYRSFHIDEEFRIDFSEYEEVIQLLRILETLGFIVGLVLITRNIIKG